MSKSTPCPPLGNAPLADEDWRTEIALFRYTLILPLLRHDRRRDGSKKEMRAALAQARHAIPHSQRHTISIASLRRWEKAYRKGGFEALKPRPRSDRGSSRVISTETLDRAEALKRELPTRSARTLANILEGDQVTPVPEDHIAPRTLRRLLAVRGVTRARLLNTSAVFRRFERSHFGDLWQSDALHGPFLPDPADPCAHRQVFLFAFIDDHTRLIPHAQFYWNEQLPRLEDCLKHAIARYGCPLAIYADQGQVYRADQLDMACASLGVQRILATPYSPQAKGKIERFFGFIRSAFLPELACSPSVQTLDDLNQSLLAWIEVVYHRKVHSETGQSPLERFRQDTQPSVHTVDPLTLRDAFLFRAERRVTKTGDFSLLGNRYTAPAFLVGKTVQLRYDPFDLSTLEIWFNNQRMTNSPATDLQTPSQPDLTPDPTPTPSSPPTATDYLAMLRRERERLLREALPPIPFSRLSSDQPDSSKE